MKSPSRRYKENASRTGKIRISARSALRRHPQTHRARCRERDPGTLRSSHRRRSGSGFAFERRGLIDPGRDAVTIRVLGKRVLLCVLSYWALAGVAAAEWHRGNLSCGSCHLAGEVNPANANRLVADETSLCRDCHQNAVKASHPVGVKPAYEPPAGLPLNSQGEISCSTCHQLHGEGEGRLRPGLAGQQLCQSCHQPDFFAEMKDGGISVTGFGHLDAGAPSSGNIDNFSIQCMACHENSADAALQRVAAAGGGDVGAKTNHPIGLRYDDSLGFGGYRHPNRLPATVLLPQGRLSCLSCHVGYSRSHGALVMDNGADNLCSACHAL